MARRRLWCNDVVRSYWRTRHPLLRFLCLHEAVTSPFVVAISDPIITLAIIHLHFGDCLSGTLFSSRWSAMEFRRFMPPCTRFIAREDPHSKCILCLGFSHAREAVYGTSNCKICDDFRLITLRSRLEDYERESSNFSRRASSTNAPPREIAASRRAASWGSDVELEEMESEQTGLAFSLPPSHDRARANSPVEFLPDFQFPSPKARDFVSFGLDDILHTAASDSEDFGPASVDALPANGQEARPSAAYFELVDVLSRATEKLSLDWPDEPRESRASKLDDRFLIGAHSKLERRKLPFFSDLHREISSSWKQPFSSRLTNAAAADFTNLVGSGGCPEGNGRRDRLDSWSREGATKSHWLGSERAVIDGLPAEVQETIASARASATRKLYSSKWGVFESWCLTRAIDPVNCPVGPVLEFLQERLTAGAAATTLRVYVAAIAARRELDEIPLGRHRLVSAFMRGARRLRPVRPTAVPSWDLSVVLEGLVTAPFEPLESASDRILTLKVVLLLALTSLKRVGDLQAFSVSETCMDFAPGLVKVTLRPRPGYIPKVLSTSFRSQVVTLHSFHPPPFASSEDERQGRALKLYVDRSKVWRKSPQLLICFGAGRRGLATSKQRISHWVRDAISLAYEAQELPSPLSLRAHSTRGVASSQALFRGVPLEDICVAAGWSSPHTFVRFYNLDVDTAPGSQVLSVWTDRMLLVHYWAR